MKFTEEQVKLIKDFARKELQYNTHDPVEATLRGLYMMMSRERLYIVNIQDLLHLVDVFDAAGKIPEKNGPEPMGGIESEAALEDEG